MIIYLEDKFKKMNNDLYYREELFNTLCSNISDIFVIYNLGAKKIDYISPNMGKSMGISNKDLIKNKMKLLNLIPEEQRDQILATLTSAKISGEFETDFEFIKPNTKQKSWISLRIFPVYNQDNIIRYICCANDITKEKLAKKEIEEALNNLRKANEAKKEFLSHMSHELKTPINAVIGMTQIALKSLDETEKTANCLDKISTSSKKLLTLINNILDISKLDSDKFVLVNEPFYISELLLPFSSMMNTQAEINHQQYLFIMDNIKDNCLMGDSLRLLQILENCISNSLKFTPPGGIIRFEVSEIEGLAGKAKFRFIISDTGIGMSEEYLERLFVPFEQESSSIFKNYGGTGLGMSIMKDLINLMGGSIKVNSKKNIGTTTIIDIVFQISTDLPKAEEQEEVLPAEEYDCMGKRILVVEDNEINLEITCEFLKYIKARVETAKNGYEAIKLFEDSKPGYYDIILMDLHMPELNGYETTRAIRSSLHPDSASICIIAMTADEFFDDQSCLDSGMNYHISKPIDLDNFYSIIQNVKSSEEVFN
jgi:PAS domain S-box-containing protein